VLWCVGIAGRQPHRVAQLVLNGTGPQRILLLTFTRRAASEMTRRAARILVPSSLQSVSELGDLTLPVPPVLAVVYSIRGHRGNEFTTKSAKSLQLVLIT
jgi:superfamily I DNA/RNA helicase